ALLCEPKPEPVAAATPAPVSPPAATRKPADDGGVFGWIKRVFGGGAAEPAPAQRTRDNAQRDGRREERGNGQRRDGRRNRQEGRRDEPRRDGAQAQKDRQGNASQKQGNAQQSQQGQQKKPRQ